MILIIAEKPSVARTIASVVGANEKKSNYFEGNGYYVTNALGHLYNLYDVTDYDPEIKGWNFDNYPYYPSTFKYKPSSNSGIKSQIKVISELAKKSDLVVNALDADREGSLIFYELRQMLNIKVPIKRLWAESQNEEGIEKALKNLYDDNGNLEASGVVRQQLDWLLGINLTTLYTLKAHSKSAIKIGRVVLPTLYLIWKREQEIKGFNKTYSYALFAKNKSLLSEDIPFQYIEDGDLQFEKKEPLEVIEKAISGKNLTVKAIDVKKTSMSADKLFSLTDLQSYVSTKHQGFTASKVLTIAQELYESGYTTYPRTESRYLQSHMIEDVKSILGKIKKNYNLGADPSLINFHEKNTVFNDEKVEGHYAIIPTGKTGQLSKDQKVVFDSIVLRFLSLFMPSATFDEYLITTVHDNYNFQLKGKNLISDGFLSIHKHNYNSFFDYKKLSIGQTLSIDDTELRQIEKKPPKPYTEATLLTAMLNCGKSVEDEDEILKGFTIGAPSTRAETIEKIKSNNYVTLKGRSLFMTDFGNDIIVNFPNKVFFNVNFTGKIEKTLKDIENGKADSTEAYDKFTKFIKQELAKLSEASVKSFGGADTKSEPIGICPSCGGDVVENTKAFSCINTMSKSCNFVLWKNDKFLDSWGLKITKSNVVKLLKDKKFKSVNKKSKTPLIVHLIYNDDFKKWSYKIDK